MKKKLIVLCLTVLCSLSALAGKELRLDIYPVAEAGMKKCIFILDPQEKEADYKLELKFAKDIIGDCNNQFIVDGKVQEVSLKGWGFPYYVFTGGEMIAGTKMMCPPQARAIEKRIYAPNAATMLRYNSKLPVVVYLPEGMEVELDTWKKLSTTTAK